MICKKWCRKIIPGKTYQWFLVDWNRKMNTQCIRWYCSKIRIFFENNLSHLLNFYVLIHLDMNFILKAFFLGTSKYFQHPWKFRSICVRTLKYREFSYHVKKFAQPCQTMFTMLLFLTIYVNQILSHPPFRDESSWMHSFSKHLK